jgi:hypothetical protein
MLDLETLSTRNNAAIAAIGAVIFDEQNIINRFEAYLDLRLVPGHRDLETLDWWGKQDPAVRAKVFSGSEDPWKAISRFSLWMMTHKPHEVWANSPAFDCVILRNLCESIGRTAPWNFREERDFRSLTSLAKSKGISYSKAYENIVKHDPLSDAYAQANAIQIILPEL